MVTRCNQFLLYLPSYTFRSILCIVLVLARRAIGTSKKSIRGGASLTVFITVIFLFLSVVQLFMPDIIDWEFVKIPIIILGLISVWGLYDMVLGKDFKLSEHRWLATACQFTFFIYLFQEPTLNIVRKLIVVILGKNEYGYLISYLISPWIFTICFVFIGLQFRKYLPKVYNVCTGGR